jgi:hypothetical protein
MDPTRFPHAPHPLASGSQTACFSPWLKVSELIAPFTRTLDIGDSRPL